MRYKPAPHILLTILLFFALVTPSFALDKLSPEQSLKQIVAYYKDSKIKLDNWEEVVGLRGAGEDLSAGQWQLPDWDIDSVNESSHAAAYAGRILGILAAGLDPAHIQGRNLVMELAAKQADNGSFGDAINHTIWSVIALDTSRANYDAHKAISYLLSQQKKEGGFALSGDKSDPDITGLALIAIAPHTEIQDVPEAISHAKEALINIQLASGGFSSGGLENPESTACVIRGLIACGEDITSAAWEKNEHTMIDALFAFQLEDNSFFHVLGGHSDSIATRQSLTAIGDIVHGNVFYNIRDGVAPVPDGDVTVSVKVEGASVILAEKQVAVSGTALDALKKALGSANVLLDGEKVAEIAGEKGQPEIAQDISTCWDYYVIRKNAVNPASYEQEPGSYRVGDGDQIVFYMGAYETNTGVSKTYLPVVTVSPRSPAEGQDVTITVSAQLYVPGEGLRELTAEETAAIGNYTVQIGDEVFAGQQGRVMVTGLAEGNYVYTITNRNDAGYMDVVTCRGNLLVKPESSDLPSEKEITVQICVLGKNSKYLYGPGNVYVKESDPYGLTAMGALDATELNWEFDGDFDGFVVRIEDDENTGMSGWMYKVNNMVPGGLAADQKICDGDRIIWWYSTDPDSRGPSWDSLLNGEMESSSLALDEAMERATEIQTRFKDGLLKPSEAISEIKELLDELEVELKSEDTDIREAAKVIICLLDRPLSALVESDSVTISQTMDILKVVLNNGVEIVLNRADANVSAQDIINSLSALAQKIAKKLSVITVSQSKPNGMAGGLVIDLQPDILEQIDTARQELADIYSHKLLLDLEPVAPVQHLEMDFKEIAEESCNVNLKVNEKFAVRLNDMKIKLILRVDEGLSIRLSGKELFIPNGIPGQKINTGYELSVSEPDPAIEEKLAHDAVTGSSEFLTIRPLGKAYKVVLKDSAGKEIPGYLSEPLELLLSYREQANNNITGVYRYQDGRFLYLKAEPDKSKEMISAGITTGGTFILLEYNTKFADFAGHWAEEDIRALSARNIISGITPATFAPDQTATRAQCAALLVRALDMPESDAGPVFIDVPKGAWYAGEIAAAVKAGIIKGTSANTFSPERCISRAEFAVMISRALEIKTGGKVSEINGTLAKYADAGQIPDWARSEMALAVESGIIKGRTADTIAPEGTVSRAEATVMISRLLEKIE